MHLAFSTSLEIYVPRICKRNLKLYIHIIYIYIYIHSSKSRGSCVTRHYRRLHCLPGPCRDSRSLLVSLSLYLVSPALLFSILHLHLKQSQQVVRWSLFPYDMVCLMQSTQHGLFNPGWLFAGCSQTLDAVTNCLLLALSNAGVAIWLSMFFWNYTSCRPFRSVCCARTEGTAKSPRLPSILKEKLGKAGDKKRINSDYKKSWKK